MRAAQPAPNLLKCLKQVSGSPNASSDDKNNHAEHDREERTNDNSDGRADVGAKTDTPSHRTHGPLVSVSRLLPPLGCLTLKLPCSHDKRLSKIPDQRRTDIELERRLGRARHPLITAAVLDAENNDPS
jgi:hypothetical protein